MRRALLIGVETDGLVGVAADIAAMTGLLGRHGFTEVATLQDAAADRAGVLAAIRGLIARARPGDAVVLYYSGHGWRLERSGGGPRRYFQGLAPWDLRATTRDDFRAILSVELAALLAELTEKTANVTAIFDCCHATGVMRGGSRGRPCVRAVPVPWTVDPPALLAALAAEGGALAERDAECNPHAIRVYAASPSQPAQEDPDPARPGGWLTKALVAILGEADGGELVWADIERRIVEWVRPRQPDQRPVVVGPTRRLLFREEQRSEHGATACVLRNDRPLLLGGAMIGLRAGDRFLVAPAGAARSSAELVVTTVASQFAAVTVQPADAALPGGATARPIASGAARGAVELAVPPALRRCLIPVVTAGGWLVVAGAAPASAPPLAADLGPDEPAASACVSASAPPRAADLGPGEPASAGAPASAPPLVARLVVGAAGLELRDPGGRPLRDPWRLPGGAPEASTFAALRELCERLARAQALRELGSLAPLEPPSYALAWYAVEAGLRRIDLSPETGEMSPGTADLRTIDLSPEPGEMSLGPADRTARERAPGPTALVAGARVTAHVRNTGDVPLYVTHLVALADGEVTLLSRSQPTGFELDPGDEVWLGAPELAAVRGVPLAWPELLPRGGGPRRACLRTIVSDTPVDLRAWETAPGRAITRGAVAPPPAAAGPLRAARYAVERLDLWLAPPA